MEEDRSEHNRRTHTNAVSHDTNHPSYGTGFTGINPRNQQRLNGRSLLSLNRHRNSQQTNPTRSDNGSNASSSRNDTQLPSIPNIRFRSVRNHPNRESVEGISPLADINVRNRTSREGIPSVLSNDVVSDAVATSLNIGTTADVVSNNGGSRRQSQMRNRTHPAGTTGSGANSNTSPVRSNPKGRRNGTSPRRSYRRNNASGSNSITSSTSDTAALPDRPRGPNSQVHQQPWRPATRFSDDSDEDIALMLMNAPPRVHTVSNDDFTSPSSNLRSLRCYSDFRGAGTEQEPLELLNDSDVAGPAESSSPPSLSRDEEIARQLQQEEWERASTPMAVGFREPTRLQFLQAMHQALGNEDVPEPTHNAPRRGRMRQSLQPLALFRDSSRERNPLQIPVLFQLLPPGLMEAILGNGQFPPDEDDYEALLEMGDQIGAVSRGMSQRDINKIPVRKHKRTAPAAEAATSASTSPSHDSSSIQCAICLSEFEAGDAKRILPCQHELHKDCVDQWLKTNATCPICRKDIREGREGSL